MADTTHRALEPARKPVPQPPPCKLLEEMRNNARGDWTIPDCEKLCKQVGLEFKPPRRGSHFKAFSEHLDGMLTIPAHKPIKAPYVRKLVALADAHRLTLAQRGE